MSRPRSRAGLARSLLVLFGCLLEAGSAPALEIDCARDVEPIVVGRFVDQGTFYCRAQSGPVTLDLHRERVRGAWLAVVQGPQSELACPQRLVTLDRFAVRAGMVSSALAPFAGVVPPLVRCSELDGWCVIELASDAQRSVFVQSFGTLRGLLDDGRLAVAFDDVVGAASAGRGTDPARVDQWGLDWIGVPADEEVCSLDGSRIAILDTPVCTDHRDLEDVIANPSRVTCNPGAMAHGSHIAGIVAAITGNDKAIAAPVATTLESYPILDAEGKGSAIVAGERLRDLVAEPPDIVNMSWGSRCANRFLYSQLALAKRHTVLVAAAGNRGANHTSAPFFPAAWGSGHGLDEMVVVGALASAGRTVQPWKSSSWGSAVDLWAPGDAVVSVGLRSKSATEQASGSSMAAAFVTASIARLMVGGASAQEAVDRLLATAHAHAMQHSTLGQLRILMLPTRWCWDEQREGPGEN